MEPLIATFHIDWKIIIAQAVNFVVVFVVLYIYALKPLSKLMAERSEKISKGLDDAKQSDELLQKATEEYNKNTIKLRQIGIEAQKELQKELEKLRTDNLDRIKVDNDEWTKKRVEQLEVDKKALIAGAKTEIITLAILAAEKLTGKDKGSFDAKILDDLKSL
jgi:F-type H+-transporting ATPase subunit b